MTEGNKTCTGPRFPRFLMNKVQDSCTGPRFPRIPRFWGTTRQDPDKVPKNLGILGNLGPVHESCTMFIRNLGESWACAGLVSFLHLWSHKTCTGPRFPRFLMNKVQDSCTGPRFPRIPRFFGTIKQDPDKVPKKSWDSWESWACAWILHFVHRDSWESWACAGFMTLCQIMLFIQKMHFPCVFWWWTSELVQRVFIFWWNFWKWRTGFWFCIIGCFLRQMIAIEIILHTVYSKNTGIYSGFCMCHKLKDENEDTYVIHPLLQVGAGRGGDHMYIYDICILICKYIIHIDWIACNLSIRIKPVCCPRPRGNIQRKAKKNVANVRILSIGEKLIICHAWKLGPWPNSLSNPES